MQYNYDADVAQSLAASEEAEQAQALAAEASKKAAHYAGLPMGDGQDDDDGGEGDDDDDMGGGGGHPYNYGGHGGAAAAAAAAAEAAAEHSEGSSDGEEIDRISAQLGLAGAGVPMGVPLTLRSCLLKDAGLHMGFDWDSSPSSAGKGGRGSSSHRGGRGGWRGGSTASGPGGTGYAGHEGDAAELGVARAREGRRATRREVGVPMGWIVWSAPVTPLLAPPIPDSHR